MSSMFIEIFKTLMYIFVPIWDHNFRFEFFLLAAAITGEKTICHYIQASAISFNVTV